MASVSNTYDVLQGGTVGGSKKKRRSKKGKSHSTANETETDVHAFAPSVAPTQKDLEDQAAAAIAAESRLELWKKWTMELMEEQAVRKGSFVDGDGKPVFLKNVLLASTALESLVESCIDAVVLQEQADALHALLRVSFASVDESVILQLIAGIVKVSKLTRGKGPEVVFASKRALRDVVAAVKKTEVHGNDHSQTSWKKKTPSKPERVGNKKPMKFDKKAEIHEALESVKAQQSAIDEVDDDVGTVYGTSVSRSISDLQVAFSLANKRTDEIPKKGKKGKSKNTVPSSPLLDSLRNEEARHAEEESRLNEEINALEIRLKSLRSQLASLHVTRQQVQQRKDAIMHSLTSGNVDTNGAASISVEEQNDTIGTLESIVENLQSKMGSSEEEKKEYAARYVDALEKFFSLCNARQEDLMKTVRFVKESIFRRKEQEAKMKEIATANVAKDILKTNQQSIHELEQQLKDTLFDAGDLLIKVARVDCDLKQRADFIRKYSNSYLVDVLDSTVVQIKRVHEDIKHVAEEKRDIVITPKESVKEAEAGQRKRIDTKAIIKQEEMRVREEIAAKMQPKPKKGPQTPSQTEVEPPKPPPIETKEPVQTTPEPQMVHQHPPYVVFVTPSGEPIDPRYVRHSPHAVHPIYGPMHPHAYPPHPMMRPPPVMQTDPEATHPMMHHPYRPVVNPAGPVQRPQIPYEPPAMTTVEDSGGMESGSRPKPAWKKIGETTPIGGKKPDLPTPGEARQQGKL